MNVIDYDFDTPEEQRKFSKHLCVSVCQQDRGMKGVQMSACMTFSVWMDGTDF